MFYTASLFSKYKGFLSIQLAILAIVMVVFSILYFHKVMIEAKMVSLSKEPLIWITTGMLVYFMGNLFYYTLFNLFVDLSIDYLRMIGRYYSPSLNALFYILIAIGFWKAGKHRNNSRTKLF